jgi:undecaprenyl-diphosphatase
MQAILNTLAESFDLPILDWIQANLQSELLDTVMPIITTFGDAGIFWMVCAVLLLFFPKTRRIGLGMGFAMAMGLLVCNVTLKPLVGRIRPYDYQINELGRTWESLLVGGKLLIDTPHDFSFPSGHTIASFEASVALLRGNKKLGIPALILAFLIAFSRLYLYVHYPTDVVFSIFLGTAFALFAYWLAGKIVKPVKKGKYEAL